MNTSTGAISQRWSRRLAAVLLTFAMAGCGGPFEPSPLPPPSDSKVTVFAYNVAQGRFGDVAGEVVRQVKARRPDVVTLSELCARDKGGLDDELKAMGYRGLYVESKAYAGECARVHFTWSQGVAVYVAGPTENAEEYKDVGQSTGCLTRTTAPRVRACAVHLSSGSADAVNELRDVESQVLRRRELPLVVTGDLNLSAWHPALQKVLYRDFYEVDMSSPACADLTARVSGSVARGGTCTYPTSTARTKEPDKVGKNSNKKIDFIFVDRAHFLPDVQGEVLDPQTCDDRLGCSDHRQLWGTAELLTGPATPAPTATSGAGRRFEWNMHLTSVHDPCTKDPDGRCLQPRWKGTMTEDAGGRLSGTGQLSIVKREICTIGGNIVFDGEQTVQIGGSFNTGTVTLTFGKPRISHRLSGCATDNGLGRRVRDDLTKKLTATAPVTIAASQRDIRNGVVEKVITFNGVQYDFLAGTVAE
jgi:endonuclease/exonuclease/phosphatase family metal-dependent hydrolase